MLRSFGRNFRNSLSLTRAALCWLSRRTMRSGIAGAEHELVAEAK